MSATATMSHLRTIRLYGALGKEFGKVHRLDVRTPAEAIKALLVNFPKMHQLLMDNPTAPYKVMVADEPQVFDQLGNPFSSKESFKIIPVIQGTGGFGRIIVGALLIAATVAFPATAGITLWGTTTIGSLATSIGLSLILGGVIEMLTQAPESNSLQNAPVAENPSYTFSGTVNTTAQGNPVPVCYGELIIGSAVISTGLDIH